jgi:uncharacterized membrane protein
MPNVHPLIVHFPIALFSTGFLVSMVGYIFRKDILKNAALIMVMLGAAGAVAAALSGEEAEEAVEKFLSEEGEQALESHETFGGITVYILPAAALLYLLGTVFLKNRRRAAGVLLAAYIAAGILGVIMVNVTAYKGGRLVYEYGAGVSKPALEQQEQK